MTIDEAIKRYTSDAFYEKSDGNLGRYLEFNELVGWLKELKELRARTEWIPVEWKPFGKSGYPKPEDEYKHFFTIDSKGEITIQEFLLSMDEEPVPYFTGMRDIIAWMPLPEPYDPQESEVSNADSN